MFFTRNLKIINYCYKDRIMKFTFLNHFFYNLKMYNEIFHFWGVLFNSYLVKNCNKIFKIYSFKYIMLSHISNFINNRIPFSYVFMPLSTLCGCKIKKKIIKRTPSLSSCSMNPSFKRKLIISSLPLI